ncbi:MAG: adenine methyltransferase [Gammaproteobacteria bacterium]|jgi:hypothetical protein|nr:adenine methyltransferase [Gammaproteobacteria bacterium]
MSGMFGVSRKMHARKSVEWYTPAWVFDELGLQFDLDPASPYDMESFVPATTKYTVFDNGLQKEWFGRVWMNPPYGVDTSFWMRRFFDHNNGIAMVFSRTDASWCQEAMKKAKRTLFLSGRIDFVPGLENEHKKGRSGAGTVMFACGEECSEALWKLRDRGVFMEGV